MSQVIFTKYETQRSADGVVGRYAGTVDGIPFEADENSVNGIDVTPHFLTDVVKKARMVASNGGPKIVEIE